MLKDYKKIIEIILAFGLAFVITVCFFNENVNFENLALGKVTTPVFATYDNYPVHALGTRNSEKIIEGNKNRKDTVTVLMLGNSQSHSINQLKDKERTFPGLLFDSLHKKSIGLITSTIPNANLEEYYLLYKIWTMNLKINALVLPVFLDDMRENGIQSVFFPNIGDFKINDQNAIAEKINADIKQAHKIQKAGSPENNATLQDKVELRLNQLLENNFDLWQRRPTIRGDIFSDLFKLRNTLFGINAQSKRKIIKDFYNNNLAALKIILQDCQKKNISVLIYIPPIRNDVEVPYVKS